MDIVAQKRMDVLQEDTFIIRSQFDAQHNTLDKSFRDLTRTADAAFKGLRDSVKTSASEHSTASGRLQQTTKKQETYNKSILQSNRRMYKKLGSLMAGFDILEISHEDETSELD